MMIKFTITKDWKWMENLNCRQKVIAKKRAISKTAKLIIFVALSC